MSKVSAGLQDLEEQDSARWQSRGAQEGSLVGGLSLSNYYAKTKKKLALFIWNVWSLLGCSYPLGKGKLNPHLHT